VKRQPEVPFAVMSVGEIAVTQVERRTAAEEVRIDEHEVETATVRTAAVQHRQLRGRAEKISLGETDIPGIVAARAREAAWGCVLHPSDVTARIASLPPGWARTVSTRTERNTPRVRNDRSLSSMRARSKTSPRFSSSRRRITHCRVRMCNRFARCATQPGARSSCRRRCRSR